MDEDGVDARQIQAFCRASRLQVCCVEEGAGEVSKGTRTGKPD